MFFAKVLICKEKRMRSALPVRASMITCAPMSESLVLPAPGLLRRPLAILVLAVSFAVSLAGCGALRSTQQAEGYTGNEWLQSGANRVANLALRDHLQSIRRVHL